jgi:hypothetical protein
LREDTGWDATPYQWATAGYMRAINSGKTICGVLFGASIHLGFLNGIDSTDAPKLKDEGRLKAIYDENDGKFAAYNRFTDLSKLKNIEIDLDTVSSCVHEYRRQIKPDNPVKISLFTPQKYIVGFSYLYKSMLSEKYGRMTYSGYVKGDDINANYFWYDKGKYENPEQVKWFKGSVKK